MILGSIADGDSLLMVLCSHQPIIHFEKGGDDDKIQKSVGLVYCVGNGYGILRSVMGRRCRKG